tara:strand:+ start:15191 stop:15826 length:636 start_codon:yes stop_codon:yes gene_type:complete
MRTVDRSPPESNGKFTEKHLEFSSSVLELEIFLLGLTRTKSINSFNQQTMPAKKTTRKAPAKKAIKKTVTKKVTAKKAVKKAVKKTAVKKSPVKKVAAKKAVKKVAAKKAVKKTAAKAISPTPSSPTITRVIARVDVRFGNILYIRGEGGGLSWSEGTPMSNLSTDEWIWESEEADSGIVFKFLVNDEIWANGEDQTVAAGGTSISTPSFY